MMYECTNMTIICDKDDFVTSYGNEDYLSREIEKMFDDSKPWKEISAKIISYIRMRFPHDNFRISMSNESILIDKLEPIL